MSEPVTFDKVQAIANKLQTFGFDVSAIDIFAGGEDGHIKLTISGSPEQWDRFLAGKPLICDLKAWKITHLCDGRSCWTDHVSNAAYECVSDEDGETSLFTEAEISELHPGMFLERGGWHVECQMVSKEWFFSLPEHNGW